VQDENPPDAGSFLDLELEFYSIKTFRGANAMPRIPLLLDD